MDGWMEDGWKDGGRDRGREGWMDKYVIKIIQYNISCVI